ncbi:MAG: hypothetical protein ACLP8S_04795 [Solirubrobacteraceae bacterium]
MYEEASQAEQTARLFPARRGEIALIAYDEAGHPLAELAHAREAPASAIQSQGSWS